MKNNFLTKTFKSSTLILCSVFIVSIFISGCAPLWFAGGAATGVAVAKDAEDGKVIDD